MTSPTLNADHPVDAREIKARLELPIVRYLLANGTSIIEAFIDSFGACSDMNCKFFNEVTEDEQLRAVRVAVECALYWQLRLFRILLFIFKLNN